MPPARDQKEFQLLSIEDRALILHITLYDRNDPSGVYLLKHEVLANVVVPEVALVTSLPHTLIAAEALAPDLAHALAARGQVCIIGEIEVAIGNELSDAFHLIAEGRTQLDLLYSVFFKGDYLYSSNEVYAGAIYLSYKLFL